jgi:hypothetical protein
MLLINIYSKNNSNFFVFNTNTAQLTQKDIEKLQNKLKPKKSTKARQRNGSMREIALINEEDAPFCLLFERVTEHSFDCEIAFIRRKTGLCNFSAYLQVDWFKEWTRN